MNILNLFKKKAPKTVSAETKQAIDFLKNHHGSYVTQETIYRLVKKNMNETQIRVLIETTDAQEFNEMLVRQRREIMKYKNPVVLCHERKEVLLIKSRYYEDDKERFFQ